jgi:ATP adenylyltransferase
LRYCPELGKKPKGKDDNVKTSGIKIDPFEDPPEDLLVASVPACDPSHILVLNKYPIIANHFILATKHHKKQTHKLEADDLSSAYLCLQEWSGTAEDGHPRRLFAFFNSGEHSGASQAHRHLQFLPVEDMRKGDTNGAWGLLADSIWTEKDIDSGKTAAFHYEGQSLTKEVPGSSFTVNSSLPFIHYGAQLPARPSSEELYNIYTSLYDTAAKDAQHFAKTTHAEGFMLQDSDDGSLPVSYNLAMTKEVMIICPRRREGQMVKARDGTEVDYVALNGTLLGGTLMVKSEECYNLLKEDSDRLREILASIGLPKGDSISSGNPWKRG